jgi:hypothetical protein
MNEHEIERISAAMHALRPDWPMASLKTFIAKNLADRPRRDVTVALAWIACESATATPKRVLEAGPWWRATAVDGSSAPRNVWPDDAHRCRTCNLNRPEHDRREANMPEHIRHDFETATGDRRLPADQAHAVVGELRDHKASDPPPRPEPDVGTDGTTRVQPVRAAIAAQRTEET